MVWVLLLSLLINALVLIVPGLAWLWLMGRWVRDRVSAVVACLGLSAVGGVVALLVQRVLGIEPSPYTHALSLFLVTVTGVVLGGERGGGVRLRRSAAGLPPGLLIPAGLVLYGVLFLLGARFVQPLPDVDIEVQGTAYGLVHRGVPMMLHDRRLPYHFAHPHLLHWFVAEGLLLTGDLPALRPYYQAGVRAEDLIRRGLQPGLMCEVARFVWDPQRAWYRRAPLLVRVLRVEGDTILLDRPVPVRLPDGTLRYTSSPTRAQLLDRILLCSYQRLLERTFERRPMLWQTRMVNVGLALAALFVLSELAAALSGSRVLAVLAPLTLLAVPEVLGRFVSASYTPITILLVLGSAWWCLVRGGGGEDGARGAVRANWLMAFLAAFLLALANHKGLVALVGLVAGGMAFEFLRGRWSAGLRRAFGSPLLWGFLLGTALFWVYGFTVAPRAFLQDHIRHHLLDRLLHRDPLHYTAGGGYPAPGEMWWGLLRDTGLAIPAVAALSAGWMLVRRAGGGSVFLVLALWTAAVAVAFSIIDWRQTKHLMQLMPALVLWPTAAAGRCAGASSRWLWAGLLSVGLVAAGYLSADWLVEGFNSFRPVGGW